MSRILGIVLVVIILVVLLLWSGFLTPDPAGEGLMDSTEEGVGEIVDEPGTAVEAED